MGGKVCGWVGVLIPLLELLLGYGRWPLQAPCTSLLCVLAGDRLPGASPSQFPSMFPVLYEHEFHSPRTPQVFNTEATRSSMKVHLGYNTCDSLYLDFGLLWSESSLSTNINFCLVSCFLLGFRVVVNVAQVGLKLCDDFELLILLILLLTPILGL